MMVLDTSAAIQVFAPTSDGELSEEARSFFVKERFIAPCFFNVEASNSAWKFVHAKRYEEERARNLIASAVNCIDEFYDDESLVGEAFSEAVRLDHSVYDLLYFVLARRKGIALLTADKKLARLCEENGVECVRVLDL